MPPRLVLVLLILFPLTRLLMWLATAIAPVMMLVEVAAAGSARPAVR